MDDAAYFLRKLLCHPKFNTRSARMGVVIRVRPQGLHLWRRNQTRIQQAAWVKVWGAESAWCGRFHADGTDVVSSPSFPFTAIPVTPEKVAEGVPLAT